MHYHRFLFFNLAGGIAWAAIFSLLGYFVGNSWDIISRYLGRIGIFAFISGVIVIYIYFLFTKKKRLIKKKIGWIDRRLSSQLPETWDFIKARFSAGSWYGLNLTMGTVLFVLAIFSFGEIVEDLISWRCLPTAGGVTLYLLYRKNWWELFTFFLVAGVGEIILILLKLFFQRPRPMPQMVAAHGYSFPSNHAFTAMIVYGFLIYIAWKSIKVGAVKFIIFSISMLLIIFVGISRIYLNVHWLTDVLGGYAAGFAWLVFSVITVNTIKQIVNDR